MFTENQKKLLTTIFFLNSLQKNTYLFMLDLMSCDCGGGVVEMSMSVGSLGRGDGGAGGFAGGGVGGGCGASFSGCSHWIFPVSACSYT